MPNETEYQNKILAINFNGQDYEVDVSIEVNVHRWNENHGEGFIEPMAEESYMSHEIISCTPELPDDCGFNKIVGDEILENFG